MSRAKLISEVVVEGEEVEVGSKKSERNHAAQSYFTEYEIPWSSAVAVGGLENKDLLECANSAVQHGKDAGTDDAEELAQQVGKRCGSSDDVLGHSQGAFQTTASLHYMLGATRLCARDGGLVRTLPVFLKGFSCCGRGHVEDCVPCQVRLTSACGRWRN